MNRPLGVLLALSLLVGTPVLWAGGSGPAAAAAASPREACARAFIACVNDGGEAAVAAFEESFASEARKAKGTIAERHAKATSIRERSGGLTFVRVASSNADSLVALVEAASGPALQFDFKFVDGDRLDSVRIMPAPASPSSTITAEGRAAAINKTLALLDEHYVFPEVAKKMGEHVRARQAAGDYDAITDEQAFAQRLTEDLRSVSHDGHLSVRFSPEVKEAPASHAFTGFDPRTTNFGFVKVEVMPGNIGYVRLDGFMEGEEANASAAAAMAFVRNVDALIFDLRQNGGGSPEMIRFLSSYLFETPTHLNSFKDRNGETVEEYWTLETVPGQRIGAEVPVFVLTSSTTFSGAEEFSYNLKHLKRGTIVGETTGGGAHPIQGERVSDRFMMTVPYRRAWNPISKTNWEGTGVEPDVKVQSKDALDRARTMAMEQIKKK